MLLGFYRGGDIDNSERGASLFKNIRWIHTLGPNLVRGSMPLVPGLWLNGDLRSLALNVQTGRAVLEQDVRVFYGFAGWTQPQLKLELEQGCWVRARPSGDSFARAVALSSCTGTALWRLALRKVGLETLVYFPRGANVDPVLRELVANQLS